MLGIMTRLFTFLLFGLVAGCSRTPEHTQGDLTPYLQWTQGTPVVIHLAATSPDGRIVDGVTARGTLFRVTPDEIRIRTDAQSESSGYASNLVRWVELDTHK